MLFKISMNNSRFRLILLSTASEDRWTKHEILVARVAIKRRKCKA